MKKERENIKNNAMTLLKRRKIAYNGLKSIKFPLPNQSIVLDKPEKSKAYQTTQIT